MQQRYLRSELETMTFNRFGSARWRNEAHVMRPITIAFYIQVSRVERGYALDKEDLALRS